MQEEDNNTELYEIVATFTNSGRHIVPSITNSQLKLTHLRSLKKIFPHEDATSAVLPESVRDQGGICLPNWEPPKSVNSSALNKFFLVFWDGLNLGKKLDGI